MSTSPDSPDAIAAAEARRKRILPALVLTWTTSNVYVLCPFRSCQMVHRHGYTEPRKGRVNSRSSRCNPSRQQEYRLLFPFEDDRAVQGFHVEIDRDECVWRTVGLKDPRDEEEDIDSLYDQMATTRISADEYQIAVEEGDEEGQFFISECVNKELDVCRKTLQDSPDRTRLIRGRNDSNDTALSLACMEGHLDIVTLLCNYGPDLGNVNNKGNTPLMEALSYGRGDVANHLIAVGSPSVAARNEEGMSILDIAKASLKFMNNTERYHLRKGFQERMANKDHFKYIIDHCEAQLKNELLALKKHSSTPSYKQSITIRQHEAIRGAIEASVYLHKFTTPIARKGKTFAYLNRGEPFEDVMAVSGYTPGEFGDSDGCLDRREWTAKVHMFSMAVGHVLAGPNDYYTDDYFACHAEMQLMAYFLWTHTALQDRAEQERSRDLYALESSRPARLRMKKDIYVTNEPCFSCKGFQKRVREVTGIDFNIIHVAPLIGETGPQQKLLLVQ